MLGYGRVSFLAHGQFLLHCNSFTIYTDYDVIIIITENKADDDKVRRMKLAYSDPYIDGRQSVLMWSDLLSNKIQKQDVTLAKLRQAVQKGVSNVICV